MFCGCIRQLEIFPGFVFFSAGVSTREEMRRTLTKQWSVIIIISSTARSLAQGMRKFIRPHSPYLWEMINCASLHVADWRLPLLSQRSNNWVPASAGCPSYRRNSATSASRASLSFRRWDEKKKRWFSWRFPGEAVLRSCASRAQQSFVLTESGNAVNPVIGWNHAAFFLVCFFLGTSFIPTAFEYNPPPTLPHFFFYPPRYVAAPPTFKGKCVIFPFMSPIWHEVPVKGSRLAPFSTR